MTRTAAHSVAFALVWSASGAECFPEHAEDRWSCEFPRADAGTRTPDPFIARSERLAIWTGKTTTDAAISDVLPVASDRRGLAGDG
jgi:hypothetical protein